MRSNLKTVAQFVEEAIAARDKEWREWITLIETQFRGSTIDRATLLFIERFPPPDRPPMFKVSEAARTDPEFPP